MPRIYTRSGDDGNTGLANGQRIEKDSIRMTAIGDVDELNTLVGLLIASAPSMQALLQPLQHQLFDLGSELAIPDAKQLTSAMVDKLEQAIDALDADLPPLKAFILPGGNLPAAQAHQARAVCRRAERSLLGLSRIDKVNSESLKYLNRLSDLLFVVARTLARQDGEEITWIKTTG